jgi:hypothetical protein
MMEEGKWKNSEDADDNDTSYSGLLPMKRGGSLLGRERYYEGG